MHMACIRFTATNSTTVFATFADSPAHPGCHRPTIRDSYRHAHQPYGPSAHSGDCVSISVSNTLLPAPRLEAVRHRIRLYDFTDFSALSVELCRIGAPCAARSYACPKPLEFVSSWCISKYTYARIDCIGDTPTPVFGEPSCIVFICCVMLSRHVNMVAIAQLVEHLIVVQKVARSSRVSHPGQTPRFQRFPNRTNPGVSSFR